MRTSVETRTFVKERRMETFARAILGAFEASFRRSGQILIAIYQYGISPFLGNRCRFYPSCSQYAKILWMDSRRPLYQRLWLVIWRLLRCHPYSKGGMDLPPMQEDLRK